MLQTKLNCNLTIVHMKKIVQMCITKCKKQQFVFSAFHVISLYIHIHDSCATSERPDSMLIYSAYKASGKRSSEVRCSSFLSQIKPMCVRSQDTNIDHNQDQRTSKSVSLFGNDKSNLVHSKHWTSGDIHRERTEWLWTSLE